MRRRFPSLVFNSPLTHRRKIRGVTLIEVLVALIVLSIGLLGIAGLQVATAKYKFGSAARSSIAILLSDFTDRVRTNPDMAGPNWRTEVTDPALLSDIDNSKYTYQATWAAQQNISDSDLTSLINAVPKDSGGSYLPQDLATFDVLSWRKRVRESIPQGAVFVAGNRSTGIDVTFMWLDKDYTDKSVKTYDGTTDTTVSLLAAPTCSTANTESGIAQQTCCPAAASVPAGVRCTRLSFMP
jgi:type IV pilus assembly protein PilV